MALFGTSKKKSAEGGSSSGGNTKAKSVSPAKASGTPALRILGEGGGIGLSHILKHARITEKASMQQASGVYVFDVASSANKRDVMKAIKGLYNVTPRKVAVINVPSKVKRSARTGRVGMKTGGKKAYVYLKSGETINM
ncbi:MAG: 50S ribosomal protein L23 [Candidatus Paceibacterota bacterium]